MPRLAANLSMLFNEVDFLDRFDAAARAGFTAVEYLFPYAYPAADLKARLAANGLRQVLFNAPPGNWDAGERGLASLPGRQAAFRDGVRRALDYAATLECPLVHCMAGIPGHDVAPATAAAVYAANLAWAVEQAATAQVRLVIEPINQRDMPGFHLSTMAQAAAVIAAIGPERLGLQFDIYHCQVTEGDLSRRIATHLPIIAHMQIADVPDRHEPGTGEIGWAHLFRHINTLGYEGWIGCEYRPAGDTAAGLAWRHRYGLEDTSPQRP
jgi:hydroxypyruvate isomerase